MVKSYKKRIVDKILESKMKVFGGVLITGPKGCGKTTTGMQKAKTVIKFQDQDKKKEYDDIFAIRPSMILDYDKPILFDEWQDYKQVWDVIRNAIDESSNKGEYILTGSSSSFVETLHTGTMRISQLEMYPMSLYESGESNGTVSLRDLFNQKEKKDIFKSNLTYFDYAYLTCRGGWPSVLWTKTKEEALLVANDLYLSIYNRDMKHINKNCKSKTIAKNVLDAYCRHICSLAKDITIYNDVGCSEYNVNKYLDALKKLCIIDEIKAWKPSIRSRSTIRLSPKRNIVDPSIATASLDINPDFLAKHPTEFGHLFECLVIRDLKIYSAAINGTVSYYHDHIDAKCDAVLHTKDGKYALIEIKLGGANVYKGVDNLNHLEDLIKQYNKTQSPNRQLALPTFKMVITAEERGYRSKNGVLIIPLGCLKD